MDYVWTVIGMTSANLKNESNVIIDVRWSVVGTEDNYSGQFIGATPLKITDIDPDTFVPYDQLTQALVLSWVQPVVENDLSYWEWVNAQIAKQILAQKEQVNPNIPLPWNPTPTPTPPPTA
jgi:hypothetical protein